MTKASIALLAALACTGAALPLPVLGSDPAAGEPPPYSEKGADTCLACHSSPKVLAIFRTRHGARSDPRSPFGHGQLQCESCHGPGGAHAGMMQVDGKLAQVLRFDQDSTASVADRNRACLGCHEPIVGISWHGGAHEDHGVACTSCHVVHVPRDPVLDVATQADKCYSCHAFRHSDSLKAYAHPLREGKMACTGCHSPHGLPTEHMLVQATVNDTCYQCHADKRGPYLWEHAPVTEDCSLCHDPHGSNQPAMLVSRAPLLCQSCHSQAGHPSLVQDAGGLASGAPSKYLLGQSCLNCHSQVHGSNHPSGSKLMR